MVIVLVDVKRRCGNMRVSCPNCGYEFTCNTLLINNTCPKCGHHINTEIGGATWVK